jgi:hypothetical protein
MSAWLGPRERCKAVPVLPRSQTAEGFQLDRDQARRLPADGAARPRWHSLISEPKAFLYAFDLLELNGTDLRREPIEVRKATLASILPRADRACA